MINTSETDSNEISLDWYKNYDIEIVHSTCAKESYTDGSIVRNHTYMFEISREDSEDYEIKTILTYLEQWWFLCRFYKATKNNILDMYVPGMRAFLDNLSFLKVDIFHKIDTELEKATSVFEAIADIIHTEKLKGNKIIYQQRKAWEFKSNDKSCQFYGRFNFAIIKQGATQTGLNSRERGKV